jgi:hypothetical protein
MAAEAVKKSAIIFLDVDGVLISRHPGHLVTAKRYPCLT